MTGLVSSFGLCLVTYERYIGIVHPLHYPRRITLKKIQATLETNAQQLQQQNVQGAAIELLQAREKVINTLRIVMVVLLVLWTPSAIWMTICSLSVDKKLGLTLTGYLFPIIFMCWAYYKIQATLKRGAQQLQQQNVLGAALELLHARKNVIHMLMIVMGALVVLMNSVINPIIYVFTYKKFRKGLQDMLCCCIGRPLRPNRIEVQIAMNEHTA
ncbi:trace amine-associated receptor 5-like [Asterias rubens]|uniref:trace amine-associated receptor 5-like n=1 Tax=Asterias rubens TaxID=7604 RepID=UPI001454F1DE|nr:trace amine-associated receptor 5-like [Asterias rubens]